MPYSKSRARKDFEHYISNLKRSVRLISLKKSVNSYDIKLMIYHSSLFLLSAAIEEYLKELISDWIYELNNSGADTGHLPIETRTYILMHKQFPEYKKYLFQEEERAAINNLKIDKPYYNLVGSGNDIPDEFTLERMLDRRKYPSIKNLKVLFKRIGINNVFVEVNMRAKKNLETSLDSFLSIREAIAHQNAPQLTVNDVKRHFDNITLLISYIDRVTYSQIVRISGIAIWPN